MPRDAVRPAGTLSAIGVAVGAVTACVTAGVASMALAQQGAVMIAIEQMDVGKVPTGFDFARTGQGGPGQWIVVSDATASGGRAIEQASTDRTDYRFPLAIYQAFEAKDLEVSVRFKPIAGRVDRAGGIALRLIDPNNYYVVRANALEDNVRFYRLVKGKREQLEGANIKVSANEWHTLSLKAERERFTVTFDGKQLYTASDGTFAAAGKVALWTKADSVTRFDRIEIQTLP
jgi:Galactocerebrosidase, C-terminal lectin domain